MTIPTRDDYYRILGVERNATPDEIKRAYRALVRRYHPDSSPSDPEAEARFREISQAYAALSDPQQRARYDASLPDTHTGPARSDRMMSGSGGDMRQPGAEHNPRAAGNSFSFGEVEELGASVGQVLRDLTKLL